MKPIWLVIFAGLLFGLSPVSRARAQDDPTVRGKKVSEWFKFLHEDKEARRRQAALQIIDTEAGPKVGIVFPGLTRELREHSDPAIRARIAEVLVKYADKGEEVVIALRTALRGDKEGKVRETAALSLGKLERQAFSAVPMLGEALKDPHPGTRAAAAEVIGQYSRIDPEIARDFVPTLAECLKDSAFAVRLNAAYALGRMSEAAAAAVPALAAALLQDKDAAVRKEIAKTLAAIGPKAGDAAPALVKALRDGNAEVRQAVAVALGKVAADAAVVTPELLKAARDPDKSVRCLAIHALGSFGKAALPAVPELIEILKKDDSADVRLAAIEELAAFGPDAKAAVDVLTVACRDGRPTIREAAQEALKRIQPSP